MHYIRMPKKPSDTASYVLVLRRTMMIVTIVAAVLAIVGIRTNPVLGVSILLLCISAAAFSMLRPSLSGIVRFYPKRSMLSASWWEGFYDTRKHPRHVFLMGHSMSKTFTNKKQADAFVEWCLNGAKIRILFLSPANTELAQLQNVGKGMKQILADDPVDNLRTKVRNTIQELQENVISQVKDLGQKPLVRYATCDLPYSVMAVDDEMVTTLYGTKSEADEQPTLLIKGQNSHAYKSFKEEFERIWSTHSRVSAHEDPIVVQQKNDWTHYIGLRCYDSELPPPKQAILFPTYRCNEQCPDCMFMPARGNGKPDEMDVETFQNIVDQLAGYGVRHIELSGGGEPLEHLQADDLLSCLSVLRERTEIKLGLLTNGLHLDEFEPEKILTIFNNYVRLSRYHILSTAGREEDLARWKKNIVRLEECKQNKTFIQTAIGMKYLLCPSNTDRFVQMVETDMRDNVLRNLDHIRFRADRRIDNGTIARLEQQVYYVMQSADISDFENTVSISLSHVSYPRNFRCWLSPMNVVIAPNAQAFICCNYWYDTTSKCIGSLKEQTFHEIWQDKRHRDLRKKLQRTNCNKKTYSDCRWAEIQTMFERIVLAAGVGN